jgi:hypothetical protein
MRLCQTPRPGSGPDCDRDTKRRLKFQRNHHKQLDLFDLTSGRERRVPNDSDEPGFIGAIWRCDRRKYACRSRCQSGGGQPLTS